MKSIHSYFTFIVSLLLLFTGSSSSSAQVAADGYYHDVLTTSDFYIYTVSSACIEQSYVGQLASYNLYMASNGSDMFNFLANQSKGVGIVTTASKGRIASVELGCTHTETTDGQMCFYIYGKNTPYETPDDLKDPSKCGELIATIDRADNSANFNHKTFKGEKQYKYVGICANTGLYLTKIDFAWVKDDYTRSEVPAKSLGTICLPYAVKADGINGVKVFELAGKVTENNEVKRVVFEEVNEMVAGMPYFFYFDSEYPGTLTMTLSDGIVVEAGSKNGLHGTFVDLPFTNLDAAINGNAYIVNAYGALQRANTSSGVKANRAYVVMNEVSEYVNVPSSGARLIVSADGFSFEGAQTGLNSLGSNQTTEVLGTYSIHGTKLPHHTAKDGIVISNGRKVLIK